MANLTMQRQDAADVTAACVPCGELQSHPDVRRPFKLVHQGQEEFGRYRDLQGEQPGGGRSHEERPRLAQVAADPSLQEQGGRQQRSCSSTAFKKVSVLQPHAQGASSTVESQNRGVEGRCRG